MLIRAAIPLAVLSAYYAVRAGAWQHVQTLSCQSNLQQLSRAMSMYVEDWNQVMPPRPPAGGDFMAAKWSAKPVRLGHRQAYHIAMDQPGPLWIYCKNASLARCPVDPDNQRYTYDAGAHSSYDWNMELSGKSLREVSGQPMIWDKGPWHRISLLNGSGRNVSRTPGVGAPYWITESGFQALLQAQVIPATR
jgi:hypothetical protein